MSARHEYRLVLTHYQATSKEFPASLTLRHPTTNDFDALGALMFDAYQGTIDYDGESLEDSKAEIKRVFDGEYGDFLPEHSWLCVEQERLLGACLMAFWQVRQVPLIVYILTAARAKGQGLARVVLDRSLQSLQKAGYRDVHAFITEGNTPSERLHRSAGFSVLPYYHWQICPVVIRQQVSDFVRQVKQLLAANFVGAYLHGSLCFGSFNPNRSDIDLLVVTEKAMDNPTRRAVAELLLAISNRPSPIEISFLTRQQLQPWQHPTSFDFHYSETWRDKTRRELDDGSWRQWQVNNATVTGDIDLAGHITVINARGITLDGEVIADVFPTVPLADYRDSILNDIESGLAEIATNPVYTILNTCRTLAWLQDGQVRSKDAGGVWALHHLPDALHPTVQEALNANRSPHTNASGQFSTQALSAFAAFAQAQLENQSTN